MSIRFACKCGKHLRAGDTMAGRHTLCPKCGAIVAIPKLEDNRSGAAPARPAPPRPPEPPPRSETPAPPAENDDAEEIGPILVRVKRRNDKDPNKFRKSIWVPLDPERGPPPEKLPKPARRTRKRYNWQLETRWYQSLPYPFRAWQVLLSLAVAQAALLAWAAVLIPKLSLGAEATPLAEPAVMTLAAGLVITYTIGLFDCILASAGAGEFRIFRFPGLDLGITAVASWILCFLAGPVIPAAIGCIYWQRCGDPDALDWIILTELASFTCGYLLLEVLAIREKGGWIADPFTVASHFVRIGPRTLLAATAIPILGYLYLRMAFTGLEHWHIEGILAVPSLVIAGLTGMFGATLLLRLLGVWSFRSMPGGTSASNDDAADTKKED
jgi:hypothetical protein